MKCPFQIIEQRDGGNVFKCPMCGHEHWKLGDDPPKKNCEEGKFDCAHRGEVLRQELCNTCATGRGTPTDVYECAIHGECVKRQHRTPASIMDCVRCIGGELGFRKRGRLSHDAITIIEQPPVECPRTSKNVVCTIAVGPITELFEITERTQRAYAERIGCDYVVIRDKTNEWPLSEKFRIRSVCQQYERTLYLDADVLIKANAPNIFDAVSADSIGMNEVSQWLPGEWWRNEWHLISDTQGYDIPPSSVYFNSGVWVGSTKHADYWKTPEKPLPNSWTAEETFCRIQSAKLGLQINPLDWRWNWQLYLDREYQKLSGSWFVHLCGSKEKPEERIKIAKMIDGMIEVRKIRPVKTIETRRTLGELFTRGGVGAELGVLYGENARNLCNAANPTKMYLVDKWRRSSDSDWRPRPDETWEAIYETAKGNVCDRCELVESDSVEWLESQPANSLDWVYIDSSHTYEQVKAELNASYRVVKPGGIIAGHDLVVHPTAQDERFPCQVFQAVLDFVQSGLGVIEAVTDEPLASFVVRIAK